MEHSTINGQLSGGLRLLFAGSPVIALPSLAMIVRGAKAGRWTLAGILTNPDKRKGRGGGAEPTETGSAASPLASEFAALGLPAPVIIKLETLKAEAREAVAALKPDLLVSFAYGRIFGPKFMDIFPLGGINVHPSLLPKYRGASPIQEAILRRDWETGVCVQRIAAELDSGNILAQKTIYLDGTETTALLSQAAGYLGAELLETVLDNVLKTGQAGLEGIPQQGEPSYCTIIEKSSGEIDWNRSARDISAQIRAYNPWPLARTTHNGQVLNILGATALTAQDCNVSPASPGRVLGIDKKFGILIQTGDGVLAVSLLQYHSKKVLSWQPFINGARDFINLGAESRGQT